jgi:hypothetical protein
MMLQSNFRRISTRSGALASPNTMFVALESQLYAALVDTIDSEIDDIGELYVAERLSGYNDESWEATLSRMPADIVAIARTDSAEGRRRLGIIELDLIDFLLNCRTNRVLFLSGGVGVGKTTFIRYVLKKMRSEATSLQCFAPIILNGLAFPTSSPSHRDLAIELARAIVRDTPQVAEVNESFGALLKENAGTDEAAQARTRELEAADVVSLVRAVRAALPTQLQPVLVFDNLDHIDVDAVCDIAVLARSVHINTGATVVMALRRGMLQAVREHVTGRGGFTPFRIDVLPPDLRAVIRARMRKVFRDYDASQAGSAKAFPIRVDDPERSLNSLSDKLLRPSAQEKFMRGICANNVRRSLSAFAYFCRYRDLDYEALFDLTPPEAHVRPSYWEEHFLDGLMIGDRQYFVDGGGPITNVLFFESSGKADYLILYYCLALLNWSSRSIKANRLVNWLSLFGYEPDFSLAAIRHLRTRALISAHNTEGEVELNSQIELSDSGLYYLQQLLTDPQYVRNVVYDVPLQHESWTERVSENYLTQLESVCELVDFVHRRDRENVARACAEGAELELCGAIQQTGLLTRTLLTAAIELADGGIKAKRGTIGDRALELKFRLQAIEGLLSQDEKRVSEALKARGYLPATGVLTKLHADRFGKLRMTVPSSLAPALRNTVSIELDYPGADANDRLVLLWQALNDETPHQELAQLNRVGQSGTFRAQFAVGDVTTSKPFPQSQVTVFAATRPVLVYRTSDDA